MCEAVMSGYIRQQLQRRQIISASSEGGGLNHSGILVENRGSVAEIE
jgi:hypothetical protein